MAIARVYLAGPDVFLRDPLAIAAEKKRICTQYDLAGVFPLDGNVVRGERSLGELGLAISHANEELIRSCQLVIANITPFRGPSADVGTAYEIGFGRALGLKIFAYTNVTADFESRTRAFVGGTSRRGDGEEEDASQLSIEALGLVDNLMLAGAIVDSGGVLCSRGTSLSEVYTSLEAFAECVKVAAQVMASLQEVPSDAHGRASRHAAD